MIKQFQEERRTQNSMMKLIYLNKVFQIIPCLFQNMDFSIVFSRESFYIFPYLRFMMLSSLLHNNISVLTSILHHLPELSFFIDQLPRFTLLNDLPTLHHNHLVIVCNRVQSVGYRYHGCFCKFFPNYLLNEGISLHVHIRSGLVQNQKLVFSEESSCQAKKLPLVNVYSNQVVPGPSVLWS